MRTGAHL
jgi:hypothetical protein